jgi:RNA polymerase subunit RPABC4/transcription elongation factor Spt4
MIRQIIGTQDDRLEGLDHRVRCPSCAELIRFEAKLCPSCQSKGEAWLHEMSLAIAQRKAELADERRSSVLRFLLIAAIIFGIPALANWLKLW